MSSKPCNCANCNFKGWQKLTSNFVLDFVDCNFISTRAISDSAHTSKQPFTRNMQNEQLACGTQILK